MSDLHIIAPPKTKIKTVENWILKVNYEFSEFKEGTDSKEVRKKGSILLKDEKAN